jgi:hypothetical protein
MLERDFEKRKDSEEILAELKVRKISVYTNDFELVYFLKGGLQTFDQDMIFFLGHNPIS